VGALEMNKRKYAIDKVKRLLHDPDGVPSQKWARTKVSKLVRTREKQAWQKEVRESSVKRT